MSAYVRQHKRQEVFIPICQPTLKPEIAAINAQVVEYNVNPKRKMLAKSL